MLDQLNELVAAIYHTAPGHHIYKNGITWRSLVGDAERFGPRTKQQAEAWETVRDHCISLGIDYPAYGAGRATVIAFIDGLLNNLKAAQQAWDHPYNQSQAEAWEAVYKKCNELGMDQSVSGSGKQLVLNFIESLARNQEKAAKWDQLEEIREKHGNRDLTLALYRDGSTYIGTGDRSYVIE